MGTHTDRAAYLDEVDRLWTRGIKVPVEHLADLDRLDPTEVLEGYREGRAGDGELEPGTNRTRAFWHGWKCGAADAGHLEPDAAHGELVRKVYWRSMRRAWGEAIPARYVDLEEAHRRGLVV